MLSQSPDTFDLDIKNYKQKINIAKENGIPTILGEGFPFPSGNSSAKKVVYLFLS